MTRKGEGRNQRTCIENTPQGDLRCKRAPSEIIRICGHLTLLDREDVERVLHFRWHINKNRDGKIYFYTRVNDLPIRLHRYLMKLPPRSFLVVDHISGSTRDNRKSNLRICTQTQNSQNCKKPICNTSGFKGVSRDHGSWRAGIRAYGKYYRLGSYKTPESAYKSYCKAAKKYHGEFARLA